jgi:uncharacterized membrane protein
MSHQAIRAFLTKRNLAELLFLWSIHILLVTATLVPGTPLDVLRPVVAFVYLLVVPGLLLVRLLRVYEEDPLAQLVTAVGLSLIYDMLLGLALSGIPSSVIERPLAAEVFLPTSLVITGILSLIGPTKQSLLVPFAQFARPSSLAWALLPLTAVFVALHVQSGGSTLWMVLLVAVVAATPLLFVVWRPTAAECAVSLFSIALALAFQMYFILVDFDGDARLEIFHASQVLSAARWAPQGNDLYGSMLSVTTLPAVFSAVADLGIILAFKLLYGFVLALIPVAIFLAFRNLLGQTWAIVAVFLYVGHIVFATVMPSLSRQVVATLLLALLILTATSGWQTITNGRRSVQFLLVLALVFSHYAMVPVVVVAFGTSLVLSWLVQWRVTLKQYRFRSLPPLGVVLAVSAFAYLWFTWASGDSVFMAFAVRLALMGKAIIGGLLLNEEATTIATGIIPSQLSYWMLLMVNWFIVAMGLIGFAFSVHGIFQRDSFRTYLAILGVGGVTLGGIFLVLPQTSESLNTLRSFFTTLIWLLPLSVYGVKRVLEVSGLARRHGGPALAAIGFLALSFQLALGTGLVTHLFGDTDLSYAFDSRLAPDHYDHAAVGIVSQYKTVEKPVYVDRPGNVVFRRIGRRAGEGMLDEPRIPVAAYNGYYLYFGNLNRNGRWILARIVHGSESRQIQNTTEPQMMVFVASRRDRMNLVYSNGGSQLYFSDGVQAPR